MEQPEGLTMTDAYTNPFLEAVEGLGSPDDGPDLGAATEDGQTTDVQQEPERSYFDIDDDVAQRYVRVKVDGETVEVPLSEALQGYQRTADYTRKTQELAQQRQQAEYALALQRALEANPQATLGVLAQQYGLNLGQPAQQPQRPQRDDYDEFDDGRNPYMDDDPVAKRLAILEQQLTAQQRADQERQAQESINRAVGGLQQRYQLDEAGVRMVVQRALQRGLGPQYFDMVYRDIAYEQAEAARQQTAARRAAEDQQRQAAAQSAAALVGSGGNSAAAGAPITPPSDGPMSISDAVELAEQQLGMRIGS